MLPNRLQERCFRREEEEAPRARGRFKVRASALVFTHVSEEHDFGASVFGEVLDVYGAHVLSEMAGAEFNHHARLVFRDSERVFSFVLFAGVGRVFAELGVRSLRGGFLDLSNHGHRGFP